MKKIIVFACALVFLQLSIAQKMIIHTKTMGKVEVELAKVDSITFSTSVMPGGLMANPPFIGVEAGKSMVSVVSGGIPPYQIQNYPNQSVATATINGDIVTVTGVGMGSTSVVINDKSTPPKTIEIMISVSMGPGGLTANPQFVEMMTTEQRTSTISGGTAPYSIHTAPDAQIATATVSGSTVTITGVGGGRTFAVIKDNSTPNKTVMIEIRVRVPFTTPGTLAFSSTVKNFSASGIFMNTDSLPTNSQGVGGFYKLNPMPGMNSELVIIGYFKNSNTNWDVVMVGAQDTAAIKASTYNFATPAVAKRANCRFVAGWDPNSVSGDDPFINGYNLNSGSFVLSAFTTGNAQGTFSGTGVKMNNNVPDPTQTISISGGTFNSPVNMGEPTSAADRAVFNKLVQYARMMMMQ